MHYWKAILNRKYQIGMEKQFNREDRLMKKLLNEAGTEKPSIDFKSRIMMKIEARNAEIKPYEPLISRPVWIVLGGTFVASILALYFINTDLSFKYDLNFDLLNALKIPSINLSKTMQLGIAFVALFLLEVPFLKRFLDREYQL